MTFTLPPLVRSLEAGEEQLAPLVPDHRQDQAGPDPNHCWNVTLHVSARGLTTALLPAATGNLEVEVDLVDHRAGLAGWDLDDARTDWCPIVPIGDHRG